MDHGRGAVGGQALGDGGVDPPVDQPRRLLEVIAHLDAPPHQPVGDLVDLQAVDAIKAERGLEGKVEGHAAAHLSDLPSASARPAWAFLMSLIYATRPCHRWTTFRGISARFWRWSSPGAAATTRSPVCSP